MGRATFRKKITSDELTAQINPANISMMKRFLKEKSTRTSDKTIVVYSSNLTMFFTWNLLYNDNKEFVNIKKLEFADFFSFAVDELKLGSAKLNNMRSTLSSLSTFIEKFYDEEYPNFRNVILKVVESSPKETRREKTILSDEQIESLLEYLTNKGEAQKACWIALAVCSGARLSELMSFTTNLIDENRTAFGDLFLETTKQIKTKGRGKSGKLLYKYILRDKFLIYYIPWIKEREKIMNETGQNHDFIFIKKDGTPVNQAVINTWINEFEKFLNVPVYTHALRHYLATLLSRKNIPQPLIKEIFGWSSLEMVQVYNDMTIGEMNFPELENLKGL